MELNKIYNMDCLEGMDLMIKQGIKVDVIITDIPQEITQNDWDRAIPLEQMWKLLYQLRRDKRTPIVLFTNQPFTTDLIGSNKKHFKYLKYWHKDRPTGFLNAKKQPLRDIEEIAIFCEDDLNEIQEIAVFYEKQCLYNPQFWEGEPLHGMGQKYKEGNLDNNNYGDFASHKNPSANRQGDTKKYPRQLMVYPRPHPPIHPTEKPVDLMEDLILTYTNEDDTVLDFTMGSGTTAIACINTGRKYIGFELDKGYYDIANERIDNHNI
jgi:site-specific DNA-methyltransferase (adenine-specific)